MTPDEPDIQSRIDALNTGLMRITEVISDWEVKNYGVIPRKLRSANPEALLAPLIDGPDALFKRPNKWNWSQAKWKSDIIKGMPFMMRPEKTGRYKHWVIPEAYQEGGVKGREYHECFLIRANFFYYVLTNTLLGPMAAQAVRQYYEDHNLEWRAFHSYDAAIEAELKAGGLKLIDPAYSSRHVRDFWPMDDFEFEGTEVHRPSD